MISSKVAKNTLALFVRQLITALISLYAISVLITALGITDYGLVTVVMSIVALCGFISGSLSMITQRYISFALGKGDTDNLKSHHDACLVLCLICAVFIIFVLQTLGTWFINNHLVVAPEKLAAVKLLYQFLILAFLAGIFSGFYSWLIFAHEDMHVFAIFAILGAILRLGAALLVSAFSYDPLVLYGPLFATASIILMVAQYFYCASRYEECKLAAIQIDLNVIRDMLGFVGWTLFGQFSTVCRVQAVTILVNQSFNPATVAARALSLTIFSQALTFSQNFSSALNPPIIKAYAAGEREETYSLIYFGSKITFLLSWLVTLPLIVFSPEVLYLWLGTYPEEAVLFTRLALIEGVIVSISFPLMTAVRAGGQMRTYELLLGGLQIIILLLAWFFVRNGYPAYSIFFVAICTNVVMFAVRLILASDLIGLPVGRYIRIVLYPIAIVVGVTSGISWGVVQLVPVINVIEVEFVSILAVVVILIVPVLGAFAFGVSTDERNMIIRKIQSRFGNSEARS